LDLGEEGQFLHLGRQEVVVQEAARVAAVEEGGCVWGGREAGEWGEEGGGGRIGEDQWVRRCG